jgi:hypothetical protein
MGSESVKLASFPGWELRHLFWEESIAVGQKSS